MIKNKINKKLYKIKQLNYNIHKKIQKMKVLVDKLLMAAL